MSTMTFEVPVGSIPGFKLREGQPFRGIFKAGKMHVTVDDDLSEGLGLHSDDGTGEAVEKKSPADLFVDRWSGAFTRPTKEELAADPRLAYLIQKHLK